MKALSIRQPWAWLILHGGKDIENRTWPTGFRGCVLIHAGQIPDPIFAVMSVLRARGLIDAADSLSRVALLPAPLPCGGIVGSVEIVDCVGQSDSPWFDGPFGFVLRNPQPLPFLPCKGSLGFFEVPEPMSEPRAEKTFLADRVCAALAKYGLQWLDAHLRCTVLRAESEDGAVPALRPHELPIIPDDPDDIAEIVTLDAGTDSRFTVFMDGRDVSARALAAVVSRIPGNPIQGTVTVYDPFPPQPDPTRQFVMTAELTGTVWWEPTGRDREPDPRLGRPHPRGDREL